VLESAQSGLRGQILTGSSDSPDTLYDFQSHKLAVLHCTAHTHTTRLSECLVIGCLEVVAGLSHATLSFARVTRCFTSVETCPRKVLSHREKGRFLNGCPQETSGPMTLAHGNARLYGSDLGILSTTTSKNSSATGKSGLNPVCVWIWHNTANDPTRYSLLTEALLLSGQHYTGVAYNTIMLLLLLCTMAHDPWSNVWYLI